MGDTENKGDISNRIILAVIVVAIVTPILLNLIDKMFEGDIVPFSGILIGTAAVLVLIADRIYLHFRSRQNTNE